MQAPATPAGGRWTLRQSTVVRAIAITGRCGGLAVPLPYHDGHHLFDQQPYVVDVGAGGEPVVDLAGDLLLLRSLGKRHRRQKALTELRRLVAVLTRLGAYPAAVSINCLTSSLISRVMACSATCTRAQIA